jgi:hypothetical protein
MVFTPGLLTLIMSTPKKHSQKVPIKKVSKIVATIPNPVL